MNESLHHLIAEFNAEYARILWPNTLFNLVCLLTGIFGNGYVLYVNKFKLINNQESRYFIPYLAAADASASLITCVWFLIRNFQVYFPWEASCKGFFFGANATSFISAFLLLAIAVQRHSKSKPQGRQFDLCWRRASIVIIIIASLGLSVPMAMISGVQEIHGVYKGVNRTAFVCWIRDGEMPTFQSIYFGLQTTILVANITTVLVLYVMIGIIIYRRQRAMKSSTCSSQGNQTAEIHNKELEQIESNTNRSIMSSATTAQPTNITFPDDMRSIETSKVKTSSPSTKFTVMFITISVVYVLSYIPTCVMIIFVFNLNPVTWRELPVWQLQLYSILAQMYIINNIVNPLIYGYFDTEFRKYAAGQCAKMFASCQKA